MKNIKTRLGLMLYFVVVAVLGLVLTELLNGWIATGTMLLATAAAADRITLTKLPGMLSYPVAAVKIYAGTLVCINASGFAAPAADTASFKVVGVARETVDNSAGSAGDKFIDVEAPIIAEFAATSITQAMVGTKMHVVDDQTFDDATGTNSVVAGVLVEFISTTKGKIWIDGPGMVL